MADDDRAFESIELSEQHEPNGHVVGPDGETENAEPDDQTEYLE